LSYCSEFLLKVIIAEMRIGGNFLILNLSAPTFIAEIATKAPLGVRDIPC